MSLFNFFCHFVNSFSHTTSYAFCAKTKAVCKSFDIDKACTKARTEVVQRSKARKTKQQTNIEWKVDVLRKLDELSKLRGLRKDVWRIAVVLEKLAGIESQDSEEEQISWPKSKGEETEVQKSREKGKQREERINRVEEEENRMEGVEERSSSFSLVTYSVGTGTL